MFTAHDDPAAFPAKLAQQRREVTCEIEGPRDVQSFSYAGTFSSLGVDDSFTLDKFRDSCKLEIKLFDPQKVVFELSGVDVSVANEGRRSFSR